MPDLPFVSRRLHHKHSPPPPPAATARGTRAGEGSRRSSSLSPRLRVAGQALALQVGALHVATDRPMNDSVEPSERLTSRRARRHRCSSSNTIGASTRRSSLQPPHPPAARMMAAVAAGVGGADCLWWSRPLTKGRSGTAAPEAGDRVRNNGDERSRPRGRSPTWTRQGRAPGRSPERRRGAPLREPRSGIAPASAIP